MIKIYNTLTNCKEVFKPLDSNNVGMYVCGPTVYGLMHVGNARSAVIYDVLFRFLRFVYKNVTYVRNITDVDDKIVRVATERGVSANEVACYYTKLFHEDLGELNCLSPTFEPKVTDNIKLIIQIIEKLLNNKHAYIKGDFVYFDVSSYPIYGSLSNRDVKDLSCGNRVNVDSQKNRFEDFVLWKPATSDDEERKSCWPSPWGYGRPGWHIECSAMSYFHFGDSFDIHGGGVDLQFPHHDNEIAQSRCAFPGGVYARYWVHNGSLMLNNHKMSKSLGNLITIRDLIERGIKGEVIRYALLGAHYRKPMLWSNEILQESKRSLDRFYIALKNVGYNSRDFIEDCSCDRYLSETMYRSLEDDINFPKALAVLHSITTNINKERDSGKRITLCKKLIFNANILGILRYSFDEWFDLASDNYVEKLIDERRKAKERGDFVVADRIRQKLFDDNIVISDDKDGFSSWYRR